MELTTDIILRFQSSLIDALSHGASIQNLLDIAHEEFHRPMFIKGDGNMIYAITQNYEKNVHPNWSSFLQNMQTRSVDFDSVRTVSEDPEFRQAFTQRKSCILRSPVSGGMIIHANVWLDSRRVCEVIALENEDPFQSTDTDLMDIFVQYIQLHVSINRDMYLSGTDIAAVFLSMLEHHSVSPMELINVNSQTGWNMDDEIAVLLADTPGNKDTPVLAVFRDKLKTTFRDSVTFIYQNQVVSILNIAHCGGYHAVSRTVSKLISSESLFCGMSFEYTGIERTQEFYFQAQLACTVASKLERKFIDMYSAAHIRITERIHSITDLQDLIHPDLIRLDRLDPQRTSHYLETLYAFLLCGGNYTDTANYLGLHRNSLIYRMNRIQGIIKSDLHDVHNKHFLLISFLIMGVSF